MEQKLDGSRARILYILALLLFTAPAFYRVPQPGHSWGGDFSVYVWQARNLAEGQPLSASTFIVTPEAALHQPAAYPPLTSVILAPVYQAVGLDYLSMKRVLAFFTWLSLPVWFLVSCRLGLPSPAGFGAVLIFGWSSILFGVLDTVGGDGLFLLTSALALWAFLSLEDSGWIDQKPIGSAFIVSFLLLLSISTRSVGVALVVAAGLNEAVRLLRSRRLHLFSVALGVMLLAGLFTYQRLIFDNAGQYGTQFLFRADALISAITTYLRSPAALWSASPALLRYPLAGLTVILTLAAFVLTRWRIVHWYILILTAILSVYLVADSRYILPLLPLILMLSVQAAVRLGEWILPVPGWIAAAAFLALGTFGAALNLVRLSNQPTDEVTQRDFQQVVAFLRSTEPETQILSWNPRVFALYTDHASALAPQQVDTPLEAYPPARRRLVVRYSNGPDTAAIDVLVNRVGAPLVFQNTQFMLFELPAAAL